MILFFDGVCGLCNGFVDFLIPKNKKNLLKFAPLQGKTAQQKLDSKFTQNLESVVLLVNDKVYTRSSAALISLKYIQGFWGALLVFLVMPKPLRDMIYNIFAKHRYQWFGQREQCRLPSSEEKTFFLD